MLLVSVVLGTSATAFLSAKILSPVTRLNRAMERVAAGDFSVRLESTSIIEDVRATYQNFNTMVQELNATEMLQSDFISSVSHEFKTPLAAIEGYAALLQDPTLPEAERAEYVERILFSTRRLTELTGNVLLLSKVDNQAIPVQTESFRLDEQIRQALLLLEPKWQEKDIGFDVELEPICWRGIQPLMLHVWTNLIGNAVKFVSHGGSVALCLTKEPDGPVFTVSDDGPGIAPETLPHIFDRFYQGDTSHRSEGSGLGLALVRRILDFCGGTVSVESAPGAGSRFTVTLPDPDPES
jgi:signal transduction histidine kinase